MPSTRAGRRILIPLPDRDFDTTEVAVPWFVLTRAGFDVVFATEHGDMAACDPLLLTGVMFGKLGAADDAKAHYAALVESPEFRAPIRWDAADPATFDGLILPGGHAPGMRPYLESHAVQMIAGAMMAANKPVGAICHGVIVLARTKDPATGHSVIHDKRTTCLPKWMERSAYFMTAWKLGRYYRTYPAYVEDEVRSALRDPATQFSAGSFGQSARGTDDDDTNAMVVLDGHYVSARWPGDAYRFAKTFAGKFTD